VSVVHHCGCHQPPVEWTGTTTCHCSRCGKNFSGITGFDAHQVKGKCLTVREIRRRGYQEVRPGIYGLPTSTYTPTAGRLRSRAGRFQ
jgi:hypothetical protein